MKNLEFPILKTKMPGRPMVFDFADSGEKKKYFEFKAGKEIAELRDYLKDRTFIAYLLGKKGAGKGTYSKLFKEIVAPERIEHFSAGDMVREVDIELKDKAKRAALLGFLEKNYRGFLPLEKIIASLESRSTAKLLPTELILALIKRKIAAFGRKALFIDGFPRNLDQISYSLFFRDLIDYRSDPDIFVLIDAPESVIEARIKSRLVCPRCQSSRNIRLHLTKKIGYDHENKEFYLICDNPECQGQKLLPKEGDSLGVEPIRERLELDEKLIRRAMNLYGVDKVFLRNAVPLDSAKGYVDDYEITPEYYFQWDEKAKKTKVLTKPFVVADDNGLLSYSLLPYPVVVSLIRQMAKILVP
jgi:adenylate kinase family enzyme